MQLNSSFRGRGFCSSNINDRSSLPAVHCNRLYFFYGQSIGIGCCSLCRVISQNLCLIALSCQLSTKRQNGFDSIRESEHFFLTSSLILVPHVGLAVGMGTMTISSSGKYTCTKILVLQRQVYKQNVSLIKVTKDDAK